jgi:hypothetical protein
LRLALKLTGSNLNGAVVGIASATFNGTTSTTITATLPSDVTVTASPRLNLRKTYLTSRSEFLNGVPIYRVWYSYWFDDEDGISSFSVLYDTTQSYSVDVDVRNGSAGSVNIIAWIDFDRNGVFDADEATITTAIAGTLVFNNTTGVNEVSSNIKTLTWSNIGTTGADINAGTTYARFRITSDASITASKPGGFASDGEVEDYQVIITSSGKISGSVLNTSNDAIVGAKVKLVDPSTAVISLDANNVQITTYDLAIDVDGNQIPEVTVNSSTGTYSFSKLPIGDYKLVETNPDNYI